MKIRILESSKTDSAEFKSLIREFLKRISAFAEVEMVELKEIKSGKTFTREMAVKAEGEIILAALKGDELVVVLDEKGKELSSVEFAEFLEKQKDMGQKLVFIIGGPFGLSEEVKRRADFTIALSKMTFTHQMVRIFLLEQIYRAFTIIAGKDYHH